MVEKYKVKTLNNISRVGLELFSKHKYIITEDDNADAILLRSFNLHETPLNSSLSVVGRAGAGVNNIPVDKLSTRGVPVFNTPGANANAVKELVIAAILISARNIVPAISYVAGLQCDRDQIQTQVERAKKKFSGVEIQGRKIAVIGLGKIGSLVAGACINLGMRVVGYDPTITVDGAWGLSTEIIRAKSLEEAARDADFVSIHIPLTKNTRGVINSNVLAKIKNTGILINFSRADIVENDAVILALKNKKIGGYVTDFPTSDLNSVAGVCSLPHLGASTTEAEENCASMVAKQIIDYLENGNIVHSVNLPEVIMSRESAFRVGIANKNVPNMVGQISTLLAANNVNIHNMLNKSRGELAYTLVDVDSPVNKQVIDAISTIEGVLRVRYMPLRH